LHDELRSAGLRVDGDDPVRTIWLCRPDKRNAQTPAMWHALREIGRTLPGSVRAVVVRGEGPSFSAGLDRAVLAGAGTPGAPSLAELARLPEEDADSVIAGYQEAFSWLRRPDLVSVAAVQGHAIGAGLQLALACDLRLLASDAQLAIREPSLGLVPDLGGTAALVALVGYARAFEICVTGRFVPAQEARELGLAELVVAPHDLDGALADLLAALLAAPRDAVVETKALLLAASRRGFADQLAAERAAQVRRLRDLAGLGE
jgi:enoyl-CoA hydratase/carnithine racemase